MSADRYPLAADLHGDPLDVPESAVAWRVRRASGRPGRPANVYDSETGRQLEVPLTATVDDLRDAGCPPGRYRLEAVDGNGRAIPGVAAFTELSDAGGDDDDDAAGGDQKKKRGKASSVALMGMVQQSMDVQCRMLEAMASAFGPMRPAQAAPIVVEQPAAAAAAPSVLANISPDLINQIVGMLTQIFGDTFNKATAQAAAAAAPPVGGAS